MNRRLIWIVALIYFSAVACAQQPAKCHGSPIVRINGDSRQQSFLFEGKSFRLFPLDAVAAYDEACHQTAELIIVAAADVPVHVMLEAAGNSGKLEIEKTRIFVAVRDHYNEITVGDPVRKIPTN